MRLLPKQWLDCELQDLAALAPIQWLKRTTYTIADIQVGVKREDLLCPYLGGNKFYKLFQHLKVFKQSNCSVVASFGGPYSNHLYALASAGRQLGIPTMGFVRGDYHQRLSSTLLDVQSQGMHLQFLSAKDYKLKQDSEFLSGLEARSALVDQTYWIAEGGAGEFGLEGPEVLGRVIQSQITGQGSIHLAAGTGTTAQGIALGASRCAVTGYVVLKVPQLEQPVVLPSTPPIDAAPNLHFDYRFHCGGYAKFPQFLKNFMQEFENETKMLLDPVYTAKLFWALEQRCLAKEIEPGSTVILVHTGGLQGRRGFDLPFDLNML